MKCSKKNISQLNLAVGDFIKKIRREKGITGNELGFMVGVSQQQISRYERGESNLSIDGLVRILTVMNITLLDFSLFLTCIDSKNKE